MLNEYYNNEESRGTSFDDESDDETTPLMLTTPNQDQFTTASLYRLTTLPPSLSHLQYHLGNGNSIESGIHLSSLSDSLSPSSSSQSPLSPLSLSHSQQIITNLNHIHDARIRNNNNNSNNNASNTNNNKNNNNLIINNNEKDDLSFKIQKQMNITNASIFNIPWAYHFPVVLLVICFGLVMFTVHQVSHISTTLVLHYEKEMLAKNINASVHLDDVQNKTDENDKNGKHNNNDLNTDITNTYTSNTLASNTGSKYDQYHHDKHDESTQYNEFITIFEQHLQHLIQQRDLEIFDIDQAVNNGFNTLSPDGLLPNDNVPRSTFLATKTRANSKVKSSINPAIPTTKTTTTTPKPSTSPPSTTEESTLTIPQEILRDEEQNYHNIEDGLNVNHDIHQEIDGSNHNDTHNSNYLNNGDHSSQNDHANDNDGKNSYNDHDDDDDNNGDDNYIQFDNTDMSDLDNDPQSNQSNQPQIEILQNDKDNGQGIQPHSKDNTTHNRDNTSDKYGMNDFISIVDIENGIGENSAGKNNNNNNNNNNTRDYNDGTNIENTIPSTISHQRLKSLINDSSLPETSNNNDKNNLSKMQNFKHTKSNSSTRHDNDGKNSYNSNTNDKNDNNINNNNYNDQHINIGDNFSLIENNGISKNPSHAHTNIQIDSMQQRYEGVCTTTLIQLAEILRLINVVFVDNNDLNIQDIITVTTHNNNNNNNNDNNNNQERHNYDENDDNSSNNGKNNTIDDTFHKTQCIHNYECTRLPPAMQCFNFNTNNFKYKISANKIDTNPSDSSSSTTSSLSSSSPSSSSSLQLTSKLPYDIILDLWRIDCPVSIGYKFEETLYQLYMLVDNIFCDNWFHTHCTSQFETILNDTVSSILSIMKHQGHGNNKDIKNTTPKSKDHHKSYHLNPCVGVSSATSTKPMHLRIDDNIINVNYNQPSIIHNNDYDQYQINTDRINYSDLFDVKRFGKPRCVEQQCIMRY